MKTCNSNGCNNPKPQRGLYCNQCRNSKQRYGISAPEREKMLLEQGGICKLCKTQIFFDGTSKQYSACVDHNHVTGSIRGILCGNCNTSIGYLENKNIDISDLRLYLNS